MRDLHLGCRWRRSEIVKGDAVAVGHRAFKRDEGHIGFDHCLDGGREGGNPVGEDHAGRQLADNIAEFQVIATAERVGRRKRRRGHADMLCAKRHERVGDAVSGENQERPFSGKTARD